MLEVDDYAKFKLNEGFVLHQVEELDKYWLFNIKTGDIFNLNEVSSFILQKLNKPTTITVMISYILENFEAEEDTVKQDTVDTLEQLLNEGIISKEEGEC